MSGLWAVLEKETIQAFRARGLLSTIIWLPLLQVAIIGMMDMNVRDVPSVVLDQGRGPESRRVMRELHNTGIFDIVGEVSSRAELRDEIRAGRAAVGIELPPDIDYRIQVSGKPDFLVLVDGSDAAVVGQVLAAVDGLSLNRSIEKPTRHLSDGLPVTASSVVLFNPDSRSADLILPGLMAILLLTSVANVAAFSIVGERAAGTFDQIALMPISRAAVLAGKAIPYIALGQAQFVVLVIVSAALFRLPINGDALSLLFAAFLFLLAIIALALCISTISPNHIAANAWLTLHFIPCVFISGYVFPVSSFPPAIQAASNLLPVTHFIALARGIMIRGATLSELAFHAACLVGIAAICFLAAVWALRRATQ